MQLLWIALGVYVIFCAYFFLVQADLVYFPDRRILITPDQANLEYESIAFRADDGVQLAGWMVPAENAQGVLLFCHGNAGNISHRLESLKIFHRLQLSTLIFDYRGYGESQGTPSEEGTYHDAEAAWRYLTQERGVKPEQIVIFGRSLGGAVAAWLARYYRPTALIVESSFTSIPAIGAEHYPFFPVRLLSRFSYNTQENLRHVKAPVLIVHSRQDEIIPFHHGRNLLEAAGEPKEFLELSGDHNTGFLTSGDLYEEGLILI